VTGTNSPKNGTLFIIIIIIAYSVVELGIIILIISHLLFMWQSRAQLAQKDIGKF
jgi:hypothetical protein